MKSKTLFLIVFIVCLLAPVCSFAEDTDLYMASGEGVNPNILIIFDNSGSMNDTVQSRFYDPAITYDSGPVPVGYRDGVYRKSGGTWLLWKNSIADVQCAAAQTALTSYGHYEGRADTNCTGTTRQLRTGNYRNYIASGGNQFETKLSIAKGVIRDFLNTINGARLGLMIFNPSVTDHTTEGGSADSNSHGGRIHSTIKSLTAANRTQLINDVNSIVAQTWTPLAETLYEAGLYYKGGPSYFNSGVTHVSPIEYHCQRNYVVLITDGDSARDQGKRGIASESSILATVVGDRDGDGREPGGANQVHYIIDGQNMLGTDYLDDVAKYLYDTDLRSDLTGQQDIITYTIGFNVHSQHDLLDRTATHGHGRYFYTENAQQLSDAFQNIMGEILEGSFSFVAPTVPVSRVERTTAGDKIYLALFRPVKDGAWYGNIKKYGVAQGDNPQAGVHTGYLLDANGAPALDPEGHFLSTSRSFWSSSGTDGGETERGGVGEVLMNRSSDRNIYTYLGTSSDLTHSSNAFTTTNPLVAPGLLGLSSATIKNRLVNFVHGKDAYDDNNNGDTTEKRDWILGSFLHSRPLLIRYGESRTVIFAGSNDGMLHAFDDETGEELWGFIPPNLLTKLQTLRAEGLESFVDGSPKAYVVEDSSGRVSRAILIFGERRGGNHYYALDVTAPLAPKYLWRIGPDMADYSELGQTWSSPIIGKILHQTTEKYVAFIGGGYDENQDIDHDDPGPDSKGRAIYVVDVLTGGLVWRHSRAENAAMTHSIPSDIGRVDTNGDGRVDRLYVGDMKGQMWRFDIGDPNPANWRGKVIFQSSARTKIFYPPDVTLENEGGYYQRLYFGTGDREHPKDSTIQNAFYVVKDKNTSGTLTEVNLVDVTADELQTSTDQGKTASILHQLRGKSGWYVRLNANPGEKVLSTPVVFNRGVYFTTFSPPIGTGTDPCLVSEGTARMYVLKHENGNAVFNLDRSNDGGDGVILGPGDRVKVVGTGIPSGVIVTFINDQSVGYIGVGGGLFIPFTFGKNLIPIQWHIVF